MKQTDVIGSFGPDDLQRLEGLLHTYLSESNAHAALVLDRAGRLLTTVGETRHIDGTTFASLAAADFAASDQLAELLGESEFTTLFHQGDAGSMYLVDVDGWAILAVLFDGRTTLGLIRLKTKTMLPEFGSLFSELASRERDAQPARVEAGWLTEAEDEIDRLFAD